MVTVKAPKAPCNKIQAKVNHANPMPSRSVPGPEALLRQLLANAKKSTKAPTAVAK